ncbi:hypothetical protein G7046_g4010 [Stylonectria norvegica]|nr:hypothetical protein G7046_g4010 [Stylonectria norvegica]
MPRRPKRVKRVDRVDGEDPDPATPTPTPTPTLRHAPSAPSTGLVLARLNSDKKESPARRTDQADVRSDPNPANDQAASPRSTSRDSRKPEIGQFDSCTNGDVTKSLGDDDRKAISTFNSFFDGISDKERFTLCEGTRDRFLQGEHRVPIMLASHEVMYARCTLYKQTYQQSRVSRYQVGSERCLYLTWVGRKEDTVDLELWWRFIGTIEEAASHWRSCLQEVASGALISMSSHSQPLVANPGPQVGHTLGPQLDAEGDVVYLDKCLKDLQDFQRPQLDVEGDGVYLDKCRKDLQDLQQIFNKKTWAHQIAVSVERCLSTGRTPTVSGTPREIDLHMVTSEEAREMVATGNIQVPLVTFDLPAYPWGPESRPIVQFLDMLTGDEGEISVQQPGLPDSGASCASMKLATVIKIFKDQDAIAASPINILDLYNPLNCGRPSFLKNPNCFMLCEIQQCVLGKRNDTDRVSAERAVAPVKMYRIWKQMEHWALLSQGGNNTAAHSDSKGMATWITAQEAGFGFGWWSQPTLPKFESWGSDPDSCDGGQWRYVFLRPGQTVFFPSGTIHFVFRARDRQTLAIGGHVLQWSNASHWLDIVELQIKNPSSTNEAVDGVLLEMLKAVRRLVMEKKARGTLELIGGLEKADEILKRAQEVEKVVANELDRQMKETGQNSEDDTSDDASDCVDDGAKEDDGSEYKE